MSQNEIVEKIKKLLRLSQSPYPEEAASALAKAYALAAQHQVDISRLPAEESENKVQEERTDCPARLSRIRSFALGIVITHFNVDVVRMRNWTLSDRIRGRYGVLQLAWIGSAVDIQLAQYIYAFIVRKCQEALAHFAGQYESKTLSTRRKTSFINGFFYGIKTSIAKCRVSDEAQYALVVRSKADQRRAYIGGNIGKTQSNPTKKSRLDRTALFAGIVAGESVAIPTGIATQPEVKARLFGVAS